MNLFPHKIGETAQIGRVRCIVPAFFRVGGTVAQSSGGGGGGRG